MKALVRLSPDITTKAPRTRARFVRRLVANLRAALDAEGIPAEIERDHVRIYVDAPDERALPVLRRVFGVHSVSPCLEEPAGELDDLVRRGEELYADAVRGRRFAVRARVRDRVPYRGQDVNVALGAALARHGKVDLTTPEITVSLEVRGGVVRWYTETVRGEGGLPLGVQGRAVVLLSGGFDSAVAAWLAMRRGVEIDLVFCRLGGEAHERAVFPIADLLALDWAAGSAPRLFVVPFEELAERLAADVIEPMRQLVLKRLMYRTAAAVARLVRAEAVVTGEALGQVSSQTLRNLRALGDADGLPVLRPLLAWSKEEIIALARRIGTHDLSAGVPEYCALVPRKPATGASVAALRREEEKVPFDPFAAVRAGRRVDLPHGMAGQDELAVTEIPEGAVVLDLREEEEARRLPLPGALRVDPLALDRLDPAEFAGKTVVVACRRGLRSAWVAFELRRRGIDAFHLAGGLSRLRRPSS